MAKTVMDELLLSLPVLVGRLEELGLALGEPPAAKGRYLPAVKDGRRLWVSGHTGRRDGLPALVGRVGQDVTVVEARDSARVAAVNLISAALTIVEIGELASVIFLRGYVRAREDFTDQPAVVDAASEVLDHAFGGGGHARAAIGVASLPGGACVELEAIFRLHR